MRIIHVIGRSGSGKTTFILQLARELGKRGRVATIKHLGHHTFTLEQGKDTTLHYSTGIFASAGIDGEKTVLTLRTTGLGRAIEVMGDLGVEFLIIEGYKSVPLPSIVLGDLESPGAVLREPGLDEAIASLGCFPEYFTQQGLLLDLIGGLPGNECYTYLTCSIPDLSSLKSIPGYPPFQVTNRQIHPQCFGRIPGIAGVRTCHNPPVPGSPKPCTLVAAAFHDPVNVPEILAGVAFHLRETMPGDIRIVSGA